MHRFPARAQKATGQRARAGMLEIGVFAGRLAGFAPDTGNGHLPSRVIADGSPASSYGAFPRAAKPNRHASGLIRSV